MLFSELFFFWRKFIIMCYSSEDVVDDIHIVKCVHVYINVPDIYDYDRLDI